MCDCLIFPLQSEELIESPILSKYHFMKKEPVDFDIMGFASYLQTLDGGNKETKPAKAIAAHVKGYFQYSTPTKPPHMALLDFHKLQNYFTQLKSESNSSATTIADKLRAIRQAIEYVQYEQTDEGCSKTHMKCQEVKDRLKKWGNGLTKDIRRQRNHMSIKSHHKVCKICHIILKFTQYTYTGTSG